VRRIGDRPQHQKRYSGRIGRPGDDGAFQIDRESAGVAPNLGLSAFGRENVAGAEDRSLGRTDQAGQIGDLGMERVARAPAPVWCDNLRREDYIARPQMRREAAGRRPRR
jgi:hypothetical protein